MCSMVARYNEAVVRAQEGYSLGSNDWEPVDASGTPDCTLACARTALHRQ